MFLSLLLTVNQPTLSCKDYDWIAEGVYEIEFLRPEQKLDILSILIKGTDPICFRVGTKDAHD